MKLQQIPVDQPQQEYEVTENTKFFGRYTLRGDQQEKVDLRIKHIQPNTYSRILIKAVLYDNARLEMSNIVNVAKGAKGCDTHLRVAALMMSPNTKVTVLPAMEITENEIKGGHGLTVSNIDPASLHMLMARGLSREQATQTLADAFLNEVDRFTDAK